MLAKLSFTQLFLFLAASIALCAIIPDVRDKPDPRAAQAYDSALALFYSGGGKGF